MVNFLFARNFTCLYEQKRERGEDSMDIFINLLQGKTKMIAERIDKCGNDNNKIDMKEEVSLFKSVLAEKVREGKMSEFEFIPNGHCF